MKSLILTFLYLAKDTLHRWLTRLSSPLARVLVVFFLSLCALCFLGSYVISTKVVRDRIVTRGGDLVYATIFAQEDEAPALPSRAALEELFAADSYCLKHVGSAAPATDERKHIAIYTYDFCRMPQMVPLMAPDAAPTLLYPAGRADIAPGPFDITFTHGGEKLSRTIMARPLPEGHLLGRMLPQGGIIIQPELAQDLFGTAARHSMSILLLRLHRLDKTEDLRRVERYLNDLCRLEHTNAAVTSAAELLAEMDTLLGNQNQCRATFCLGIIGIVGILLTALAGMEYRQNEYIYTLMKSFGIHPIWLVGGFVAENLLLVGAAFVAAIAVFMQTQHIIIRQFFPRDNYLLSLNEIAPEIRLIALALTLCVLLSSLPILMAANREIGRVLK
ncbi:MAG: hypothetical protein ACI4OS_02580 [Akkermansia sp.]